MRERAGRLPGGRRAVSLRSGGCANHLSLSNPLVAQRRAAAKPLVLDEHRPGARAGRWGAPDLARVERLLYTRMGLCGIIDRARYPLIRELVVRVVLAEGEQRRLSCLYALIEELAAESQSLAPLSLKPSRQFLQLSPALERVQNCLNEGRAPQVDELCHACALSPAAFRRAFHLAMGQPPQQYILACQMKKAQRLLLLTDRSTRKSPRMWAIRMRPALTASSARCLVCRPGEYRARLG